MPYMGTVAPSHKFLSYLRLVNREIKVIRRQVFWEDACEMTDQERAWNSEVWEFLASLQKLPKRRGG